MAKKHERYTWEDGLRLASRRYSKKEAESFYEAMTALYKMILREKPDLVVWPLRGTWSFVKILRLIASYDAKSSFLPEFCQPKVGQVHSEEALKEGKLGRERALTQEEKLKQMHDALARHLSVLRKDSPKVFLVDEVLTGGAIFKNHELLRAALRQIGVRRPRIVTVAIEHTGKKRKSYDAMARHIGMKRFRVARLFTVDKLQFMHPMARKPPRTGKPSLVYSRKAYFGTQQLINDISQIHKSRAAKQRQRHRK